MVIVGIGNLVLIVLALSIGGATSVQTVGYTHRNPDHFDLFVHDLRKDLTVNLTRTSDADEPEWDWSPDGLSFVYTYAVPGQAQICILKRERACIDPQSTWDQKPKWSPSGDQVAFLTLEGVLSVYTLDSREIEPYNTGDIMVVEYNWSPDGKYIAFNGISSVDGKSGVYLLDLADGEQTLITNDYRGLDVPQWSPDGTQFIFSVSSGIGSDIMIVNTTSGTFQPLTTSGDTLDPIWSPDGQQVLYLTWSSTGTTWTTRDLTTGEESLFLSHQPALDSDPIWSADGKWLSFISYNQRQFSVWLIDIEASSSRPLTYSRNEISALRWQP